MSSSRLRVVVAGDAGPGARFRQGAVVALSPPSAVDLEGPFVARTVVEAGGKPIVLAQPEIVPVVEGDRPVLVLRTASKDQSIRLETRLRLDAAQPMVVVTTRLENRSGHPLRNVRVGDSIRWPGAAPFVPGFGHMRDQPLVRVPWVARQAGRLTFGVAFSEGTARASFQTDRIGPLGVDVMGKAVDVAPAAAHRHERVYAATPGDVAAAAGLLWPVSGVALGWAEGTLSPPPSWAKVTAKDVHGNPVLEGRADPSGAWRLPLPPGGYRIELNAPGGHDEQAVQVARPGSHHIVTLLPPEPARLRLLAFGAEGIPIASRWTVRGVAPTTDPDLGALAMAEGNVIYSRSGDAQVELPPGRYRVRATHGPARSLYEQEVVVGRGRGANVRARLVQEVETRGWVACDFHLHAAPSFDSDLSLEDRVVALLAEGVQFAAATDHNHITDYGPAIGSLSAGELLTAVPGVEITTRDWGHFNAFPLDTALIPPPSADVTPDQIFADVRARAPGAVVQVNHPRLGGIGYFSVSQLNPTTGDALPGFSHAFDAIELYNGFDVAKPARLEENLGDWFALLNVGRRYVATGNSDSHRLSRQWAGYPRTYVFINDAPLSGAAVAAALRAGRALVTNGPFIEVSANGAPLGSIIATDNGRVRFDIRVRAPSWMEVGLAELIEGGRTLLSTELPAGGAPLNHRWAPDVIVEHDSWFVVIVRGGQPLEAVLPGAGAMPFAVTNPLFIDRDGDGKVVPPPPAPEGDAGQSARRAATANETGATAAAPPPQEPPSGTALPVRPGQSARRAATANHTGRALAH